MSRTFIAAVGAIAGDLRRPDHQRGLPPNRRGPRSVVALADGHQIIVFTQNVRFAAFRQSRSLCGIGNPDLAQARRVVAEKDHLN